MKAKAIVAAAVVLVVLLFIALLFSIPRKSPQEVTVRHVGSVQSGDVTTMTFEITNHTTDPYIFAPFEVRVRNGNDWVKLQDFNITKIHPIPTVDPKGVASYAIDLTNLPTGSVLRFSIRPQKILLGFEGFVRRAELNLKQGSGGGSRLPLNPLDQRYRTGKVFGRPKEAVSVEWIETAK